MLNRPVMRTGAGLRWFLFTLLILLLLAGCQNNTDVSDPASTATQISRNSALPSATRSQASRSHSKTPSPTVEPTGTNAAESTITRLPSSTPLPTETGTPTLAAGMVSVSPGRVSVPILLYHHVSDKSDTRYTISVATFRSQMELLHKQGYQTINISTLADVIRKGGMLPEKVVAITFDDGYLDTYENAFPIMQEYGFTATAYIITSTLQDGKGYGYMQQKELKELLNGGWEIGSHSVTHTDLNKSKLGIGNEMKQSRQTLEDLLGVPVRSFSYPYGIANDWIKERAEEFGYDSAVGLDIVMTQTTRRLYYLSRREVYRSLSLNAFAQLLELTKDEIAANTLLTQTPSP